VFAAQGGSASNESTGAATVICGALGDIRTLVLVKTAFRIGMGDASTPRPISFDSDGID